MTLIFRGSGTNKAQFKESILCLDTFRRTLCIFQVLVLILAQFKKVFEYCVVLLNIGPSYQRTP
jgi:hypothetical protein